MSHECDSFLDEVARGFTSLILYFPQAEYAGYIVQYSCLLCHRGLYINFIIYIKLCYEDQQIPSSDRSDNSLYKGNSESNKGDRS